jgi:hypothetical protein
VRVGGAVVVDEGDQVRVQGQVAVVAKFADRDVQPVSGADEEHPQGAEPVGDGGGGQPWPVLPGPGGAGRAIAATPPRRLNLLCRCARGHRPEPFSRFAISKVPAVCTRAARSTRP